MMKKILILLVFYSNVSFSQNIDWKAIFLSKEKWYVKLMKFGNDTFTIASVGDLSSEMPDNQFKDEYGLQVFDSNLYYFTDDLLTIY
jgi:hypothetical protein